MQVAPGTSLSALISDAAPATERSSREGPGLVRLSPPLRLLLAGAVAAGVFALDRVTKGIVVDALAPGQTHQLVGDVVRVTHVQNTGAAFGLLPERTVLLSVLSIVAVIVILAYYRQLRSESRLIAATLGLVLGGALGNLYDRLAQGYVVDFVDVGFGPYRWWAFNVADASIVVGIAALLGVLWLEERGAR